MSAAPTIVGAGLAGLIAAHAWPKARLVEVAAGPAQMHQALLRFRSDAVANLTGIEFQKVLVRKGVWMDGNFIEPNIRAANLYAQKCLGVAHGDRSIWNLAPVERFIAPPDFYERLLDNIGDRITWGSSFDFAAASWPVVSTAPMQVTAAALGVATTDIEFRRAPITVQRFRIADAALYQTVYFPAPSLAVYRASMTGDVLIVESMEEGLAVRDLGDVLDAFGLSQVSEPLGAVKQSYGKIAAIDDTKRKQLLFQLTHKHQVYSLGRFATWRNVLLDDVVADIRHIKALMRSGSAYDLRKVAS